MQSLGVDTGVVDLEVAHVPVHQIGGLLLLELEEGHGVVVSQMGVNEHPRDVQLVLPVETLVDFAGGTFRPICNEKGRMALYYSVLLFWRGKIRKHCLSVLSIHKILKMKTLTSF